MMLYGAYTAMTEPQKTVIVADAGPLIHLDELNCLDVLGDYPEILVPSTVWQEVGRHRPQVLANKHVHLVLCAEFEISPEVLAVTPFYTLHQGETEALMLCMQFVESTLLTDDTAARLAAQSLGVSAHGTLGLLLRAIRRGTRTKEQVSHILAMIPSQSSLHIRPSLLADIIRQTKELH